MPYLEFSSGIDSLDEILQGILKGDNVVLQTESLDEYLHFALPFARRCISDGKPLVYFRFAEHPRVLPEGICEEVAIDPKDGFEQFIDRILSVAADKGVGACYVFDCLSDLAVDWYTDRMLANFFMLTCPYLYRLDTVAYFMLLKNHNTRLATDAIQNTAQVVRDVFRSGEKLYILPVKADGRYTSTLYMPHLCEDDHFTPVLSSQSISEILSKIPHKWGNIGETREDVWAKTFLEARELQEQDVWGSDGDRKYSELKRQLIRMIMTRDETLASLCEKYMDIGDLVSVGRRMIGTGLVGGKTAGMLLARKVLTSAPSGSWRSKLEQHDSFFLGSDVFYTYLIENDCWWGRKRIIDSEEIGGAEEMRGRLLDGRFPESILEQFKEMLDYFGQSPIIVRSSSLLEDAYGNSFSGKYESHFCANQGAPRQRLENFLDAVRKVYASTMSEDALSYRLERGLFHKDEQMALLIQRVSGQFLGRLYFPQIAGVAYSYNPFVWNVRIRPEDGVMRLVFGLGTRAVDQHGGDYTRIVALGEPMLRTEKNFEEFRKYSQKSMDLIDLGMNQLVSTEFSVALPSISGIPLDIFASFDGDADEAARKLGVKDFNPWVLTFEELLSKTAFVGDMREMLSTLQKAYGCPVDIEFSANFADESSYHINLLQCRPFQVPREMRSVKEPSELPPEKLVLQSPGPVIGQSAIRRMRRIIYVRPERYGEFSQSDKCSVARMIGRMNNLDPSMKGQIALVGPGRWGSKMPELGIPISFSEIRNCGVICELAMMHEGLTPDISFGTHFFNDLVEMEIVYAALIPGEEGAFFDPAKILGAPNLLESLSPGSAKFADSVHVADAEGFGGGGLTLYVDSLKQKMALFKG